SLTVFVAYFFRRNIAVAFLFSGFAYLLCFRAFFADRFLGRSVFSYRSGLHRRTRTFLADRFSGRFFRIRLRRFYRRLFRRSRSFLNRSLSRCFFNRSFLSRSLFDRRFFLRSRLLNRSFFNRRLLFLSGIGSSRFFGFFRRAFCTLFVKIPLLPAVTADRIFIKDRIAVLVGADLFFLQFKFFATYWTLHKSILLSFVEQNIQQTYYSIKNRQEQ